jgi:hypothetical protein
MRFSASGHCQNPLQTPMMIDHADSLTQPAVINGQLNAP